MCGIAGYSLVGGSAAPRTLAAQALLAGIAERGDDAVGYAYRDHGDVVAVHKRQTGASGLIDDMSAGRVQILLIHGGDPVFALPPAQGFADALANVPFVVSFNSAVDETAAQSDLILPDHTTMEGWGYYTPALTDRMVVSSQQPIMRPLYDTRATVDVLLAVARELGGQVAQALPWPNELDFVQETVLSLNDGSSSDEAFWSEWRRPPDKNTGSASGFSCAWGFSSPDRKEGNLQIFG